MDAFTISPLIYSNEMTNQFYYLTYHFINVELKKLVTRVGINLVTQNNSFLLLDSGTFRDGDVTELTSKLGDLMFLFFSPEKYIYDSDLRECRTKPYNELVLTKVFNEINFTCATPCQKNYGKVSKQIFGDLPMCEKSEQLKCFDSVLKKVEADVEQKPCTMLQYKVSPVVHTLAGFRIVSNSENYAAFSLSFKSPAIVKVNEEYVIYDAGSATKLFLDKFAFCKRNHWFAKRANQ